MNLSPMKLLCKVLTFIRQKRKISLIPLIFLQIFLEGKIYDGFMFFNEIDLLKVRLEELYDLVDHFVLVEGTKTFSGLDKALHYANNKEKFKKYEDKIIHIVMDDFPKGTSKKDNWARERYQRNGILRGLKNCHDDDLVFICDLDEILNEHAVLEVAKNLKNKSLDSVNGDITQLVYKFRMRFFRYQLNREKEGGWAAAKAAPYWVVKQLTPWNIKLLHRDKEIPEILNAGCHFNSMGGLDKTLLKWKSDSHEALRRGKRKEELAEYYYTMLNSLSIVPIDETFPRYIRRHLDYFYAKGWIADCHP